MRLSPGTQNKWKVQRYFGDLADDYDESRISEWQRYFQKLLVERIQCTPDQKVLDVGCGTGWAVEKLALRNPESAIYGIDISPEMIRIANKRAPSHSNLEFNVGDAEKLDFPDEEFDYIMSSHAFRHCPDPAKALAEFFRVLKVGGKLLILDFCRDIQNPLLRVVASARRLVPSRNTRGYYASNELRELMLNSGFPGAHISLKVEKFLFLNKLITSEVLVEGRKSTEGKS